MREVRDKIETAAAQTRGRPTGGDRAASGGAGAAAVRRAVRAGPWPVATSGRRPPRWPPRSRYAATYESAEPGTWSTATPTSSPTRRPRARHPRESPWAPGPREAVSARGIAYVDITMRSGRTDERKRRM
ncbi:hypothetical protein NKH77_53220 [Streptomyces sp. M19]